VMQDQPDYPDEMIVDFTRRPRPQEALDFRHTIPYIRSCHTAFRLMAHWSP
jgi:hypothetical protein